MRILAETGDGGAAIEHVCRLRPRFAILDVDMPTQDGFAVARAIRAAALPVEIIFLTIHREPEFFEKALELGAKGYVTKDCAATDITCCIRAILRGEHYVSPALASYLVAERRRGTPATGGLGSLSRSERQVLRLIGEYKTGKEIAAALGISPLTVKTHRQNIGQKLGLEGSHSLMKFALEHLSRL
jgi:DNA-binding NarL/FixJ family response regulator